MPRALPRRARACRFCGQGLSALQGMRSDVCSRLDCRRAEAREAAALRREADLAQRRRAAVRAGAPAVLADAPVVWLAEHGARLVHLPAELRAEQAHHLLALAAATVPAEPAPAPGAEAPPPGRDAGAEVCAFCAGRCCRPGRGHHAFIERRQLDRWVAARPGSSAREAALDYIARIPGRHVEGSCAYHGPQGCALPRELRSDICNAYRCDGLISAQQQAPGIVLAMPGARGVRRAAWLGEDPRRPLTRRPKRP